MSENSARKNKMKKKILSPLLTVGIMSICIPLEDAWASSPVNYVGTVNLPASIGTGKGTANDGWTVTIGNGSTPTKVTQDGKTVISVNDNAKITVKTDAAVEGNSNSNSEGHFNSGPNVIEFNSKSTLTIEAGGTVQQLGSTTNGEAINAHGFGNTIINNGTIHSNNGAALWFQDTSISVSVADRNKVVNHGTISTSKGDGYNVFGSSRGNAGPGLVFDNYGTVKGSLKFGSGDDSLLFGPGSKITGNVDGGGGTNDLTLDANSGESATLAGSVLNFSSITKDGEGAWAILGSVPAVPGDPHPSSPINGSLKEVDSLVIKKGLLSLVGANPDFNGTVNIDAPGQLSAQAQGINGATNMTNNGKLIFEQPIDDSYTGSAITGTGQVVKSGTGTLGLYGNNTYSGGTWVKNGTVAITSPLSLGKSDVQLGDHEDASLDGSGSTQGTLRADADIDFRGSGKSIILNKGGGTINTNGNAVILDENSLKDGIAGTASDLGRDLHKTGAGVLTLLDNQYYSGRTFIDQGILRLDAVEPNTPLSNSKGLLNTSEVTIATGARLEGQGIVGNSMNVQLNNSNAPVAANLTTIINNGTIAPGLERFNNTFDSTDSQFVPLTLAGNYRAGKGAAVEIHTELLDDISNHGSLTIDGVIDSASDKSGTGVVVIHQGGNGATTNHGIEIIRLRGSNSGATQADLIKQLDENFHLVSDFKTSKGQNAVVAGAYSYIMESDKDWYDNLNNQAGLFLRNATNNDGSLVPHPATPLYETYSLILGSLNKLPTLEQRIGHRPWLNDKNGYETGYDRGKTEIYPNNVWMRVEGMKGYYEPDLDSNKGSTSSYRLRFSRVNVGVDMPIYENADGSRLIAGINGNMSRAWSDIDSIHGSGDITTTGYGLGATLTWYNHNGFYTDAQAWHNWFKSDIDSNTITTDLDQVKGNHAKGYALSLEVGRIFDLNQHWSLTPQAQIAYSRVNFHSFTDIQNSVIINEKDYVGLEGRLGLALNYEKSHLDSSGKMRRNKLYILGNIHQEFKGDSTVSISGVDYESKMNNTWMSVGVGGSHNWDNDRFSIYGELSLASSTKKFGEEYELAGEIGLRIAF